jgi:hypothetical protein
LETKAQVHIGAVIEHKIVNNSRIWTDANVVPIGKTSCYSFRP